MQLSPTFAGRRGERIQLTQERSLCRVVLCFFRFSHAKNFCKGTEGLKQGKIPLPKPFVHLQKLWQGEEKPLGAQSHVPSDRPRLPDAPKADRLFCTGSLMELAKVSRERLFHSVFALIALLLEHQEQVAWLPTWGWGRGEPGLHSHKRETFEVLLAQVELHLCASPPFV